MTRCDVMNDVNVSSKSNQQKNFKKIINFTAILKVTGENPEPDPETFVRSTNPRIRIRTKNVTDPKHSHIGTVPGTSVPYFPRCFESGLNWACSGFKKAKEKLKNIMFLKCWTFSFYTGSEKTKKTSKKIKEDCIKQ